MESQQEHGRPERRKGLSVLPDRQAEAAQLVALLMERGAAEAAEISARATWLLRIAVLSATTTLAEDGIKHAVRAAISAGLRASDILETLECVSILGIHTPSVAIPILWDELSARGQLQQALDGVAEANSGSTVTRSRYWRDINHDQDEFVDKMSKLCPSLLDVFVELGSVPWTRTDAALSDIEKELIYIAIDAAPTHMYVAGLRFHIRQALAIGATPEQILHALAVASTVGLEAWAQGLQVLDDVLQET